MSEGYVYIMSNESYKDGIYKIGFTKNDPEQRAQELYSASGIPTPFKVEFYSFCTDMALCEKIIHSWLHRYRVNGKREFFEISIDRAIDLLIEASKYQVYIETNMLLNEMIGGDDDNGFFDDMETDVDSDVGTCEHQRKPIAALIPIVEVLPETDNDADIIDQYRKGKSISAIMKKVFGHRGGAQADQIKNTLRRYGIV